MTDGWTEGRATLNAVRGSSCRHRSRDQSIAHMPFPIGGPLEPSLYLWRLPRHSTSNVTQWLTWPWYDL